MITQENPSADRKSVQKTSKDSVAYWRQKLRAARGRSKGFLTVKIQHNGQRETFSLRTNDLTAGADKARDIWRTVVRDGWEAAREREKGKRRRLGGPTIGDYLAEVAKIQNTRERSHRDCVAKLRRIAADILQIKGGLRANDHGADWRRRVDSRKLSEITPQAVKQWRSARLNAAVGEIAKERAATTANSAIRCAKALFKREYLDQITIDLPSPLPFEGVTAKTTTKAYRSKIDPKQLYRSALAELSGDQLKIFALAFAMGLRKGEIDNLTWSMINDGTLALEPCAHWQPKTRESQSAVPIPTAILAILGEKAEGFVICPTKTRTQRRAGGYRCATEYNKLIVWLRGKGVDGFNPIHTLRKEFGSLIIKQNDIWEASKLLRHRTIALTTAIYSDYTAKTSLDLSRL